MREIMSDWKQIQARIRRAKASPDTAAHLEKLFEKTQDAMVAFELAKYSESAGKSDDAARWYGLAAQRFRRADWKKKAEEAAVRLSGAAPAAGESAPLVEEPEFASKRDRGEPQAEAEPVRTFVEAEAPAEEIPLSTRVGAAAVPGQAGAQGRRKHRGRRGGRGRRRGREGQGVASQGAAYAPGEKGQEERAAIATMPSRVAARASTEPVEATGPGLRGRWGDPGLASRLAQFEMQMRRLLACTPIKIDQADRTPAGPGVFLVTDSDLITHYYVEACKTLRIGMANLLRSGAGHGEGASLKARFAEHLGIPETRVAKYVSEHCVMRWLQLDENASGFAHFAIAVLRPVLNE